MNASSAVIWSLCRFPYSTAGVEILISLLNHERNIVQDGVVDGRRDDWIPSRRSAAMAYSRQETQK